MKLNIAACISDFLDKSGEISLPGLGSFVKESIASDKSAQGNILGPSKQKISFKDSVKDPAPFVNYLSKRFSISPEIATEEVNQYSQHVISSLLSIGKMKIPEVGDLFKDENRAIGFKPLEQTSVLPALTLAPLAAATKKVMPKAPESPKTDIKAAVPPAPEVKAPMTRNELLAQEKTKPQPVVKPTPAPKAAETTGLKSPSVELKKPVVATGTTAKSAFQTPTTSTTKSYQTASTPVTPTKKTPPPPSYTYDEPSMFRSCLPGVIMLALLGVLGYFGYKWISGALNKDKVKEKTELVDAKMDEVKDKLSGDATSGTMSEEEARAFIANHPKLSPYKDKLTAKQINEGCIIIVGVFKRSKNALRMKQKVEAAGYDSYTEFHNGLERVGLRFECGDEDLVDFIKMIRRKYDTRSWYLSPNFRVSR